MELCTYIHTRNHISVNTAAPLVHFIFILGIIKDAKTLSLVLPSSLDEKSKDSQSFVVILVISLVITQIYLTLTFALIVLFLYAICLYWWLSYSEGMFYQLV